MCLERETRGRIEPRSVDVTSRTVSAAILLRRFAATFWGVRRFLPRAWAVLLDALRAFRAATLRGADLVIVFGLMCYSLTFPCEVVEVVRRKPPLFLTELIETLGVP